MSDNFWTKLGNSDHSVSVHWESLSCSLVIGLTDKCLAVKSIRVQRNNSFSKADWAKTKTDGTLFSIRNWALLQKKKLILPRSDSSSPILRNRGYEKVKELLKPDSRKKVFFSHSIYLPDKFY